MANIKIIISPKPAQDRGKSCFYRADISLDDSKKQTVNLTKMLEVEWSMPEILLLRACHTYTMLAPYAKGMPMGRGQIKY